MLRRIKASSRDLLYGTRWFVPAQRAYQTLFNRAAAAERSRMERFYAQFFQAGDIVFDIGANVGEYAEVFSFLRAHVVAVEPNPACCRVLDRLAKRSSVTVEQAAAGALEGFVDLHVCKDSHLSTVSDEWLEQTKAMPSLSGAEWTETIRVRTITLDALAAKYGKPRFVKIDVEGYEEDVLAGMSFSPEFLSFEYHIEATAALARCLERLSHYSFNLTLGREPAMAFATWVGAQQILEWVVSRRGTDGYGDILARRNDLPSAAAPSAPPRPVDAD